MSIQRYPHLFSRAKIGPIELPNRVVMAPMEQGWLTMTVTTLAADRYYASRARGV